MKNLRRKGFTLVELLIVIAVVAILAAVLIPTFTSIIYKANMSNDEVTVRNMNTILAAEKVMDDDIKEISKVRSILANAGYSSDDLSPLSKGYKFYWSSTHNVVLLVDCKSENEEEWFVVYPNNGYEKAKEEFNDISTHGVSIFALSNIPHAKVEIITDPDPINELAFSGPFGDFYLLEIDEEGFTFDTLLRFSALETPEEAAKAEYGQWSVDFIITSNKDLKQPSKPQVYLGGQYDDFMEGWVVLDIEKSNFDVIAGQRYPLLGSFGGSFSYEAICEIGLFQCAIACGDNIPEGLIITVQLVMYEPTDGMDKEHIIYEYKYEYKG